MVAEMAGMWIRNSLTVIIPLLAPTLGGGGRLE